MKLLLKKSGQFEGKFRLARLGMYGPLRRHGCSGPATSQTMLSPLCWHPQNRAGSIRVLHDPVATKRQSCKYYPGAATRLPGAPLRMPILVRWVPIGHSSSGTVLAEVAMAWHWVRTLLLKCFNDKLARYSIQVWIHPYYLQKERKKSNGVKSTPVRRIKLPIKVELDFRYQCVKSDQKISVCGHGKKRILTPCFSADHRDSEYFRLSSTWHQGWSSSGPGGLQVAQWKGAISTCHQSGRLTLHPEIHQSTAGLPGRMQSTETQW